MEMKCEPFGHSYATASIVIRFTQDAQSETNGTYLTVTKTVDDNFERLYCTQSRTKYGECKYTDG